MRSIFILALVCVTLVSGIRVDNSKQCKGCHEVTKFIKNVANSVKNDSAFRSKLVDLCARYHFGELSSPNKTIEECGKTIDTAVNAIYNRINVDNFCDDIHACYTPAQYYVRLLHHVGDPQSCDFCMFVMDKIRDIFTGDPTEIEMKHVLEDGCHYLGQFSADCKKLVDDYVDTMISYMKNSFDSKNCCTSMRYCSTTPGHVRLHRTKLHKTHSEHFKTNVLPILEANPNSYTDSLNCVMCKKLVKFIETQLKDNATDQQIINVLNEVCVVLPENEKQRCHDVVTQYAKNLIQILTQDVDPDFACTIAGVCTNMALKSTIKSQSSNVVCVECQMITHFIQNQLYNYNNERQIEEFLENQLCKKVGHFMDEKNCDQFIEAYGPIIMQTIAQQIFDPKTFCYKEIPVCKAPSFADIVAPSACDMCINMVEKLHLEQAKEIDIERFIQKTCDHLEPTHKLKCSMMAKTFAPYIFDVFKHHDEPKQICQSLDICHTAGRINLLGGHKCTFGPSYWCLSPHHADACNAQDYCNKNKSQ